MFLLERALDDDSPEGLRLRHDVAERLAQVVSLPETRITPAERHLAGDVLMQLMRTAPAAIRRRCAERLTHIHDAPKPVLRYLARDEIDVAGPLLDASPALDDCDLIATLRIATPAHALRIAARRTLSEPVLEALVQVGDPTAIDRALKNSGARFPPGALDVLVRRARERRSLAALLLRREELRAGQGFALFWWADHQARLAILRRFASDRTVLLAEFGDLLARAAAQNWTDPEARKALQFIERRQRNRVAIERSPFGSIENALIVAAERGLDGPMAAEIAHMAGVRPRIASRLFRDPGGEPLAVFCKACGLKRAQLQDFCRAVAGAGAEGDALFARAELAFETLATAKAQTVLRHWNWALSVDADGIGLDPAGTATHEDPIELRAYASPVHDEPEDDGADWRLA